MITVTVLNNSHDEICGYRVEGHAGFAEHGKDIVCAAVSVLTLNTLNSLEELTSAKTTSTVLDGNMQVAITDKAEDPNVQLILRGMLLGLKSIEKEYKKYVKVEQKKSV